MRERILAFLILILGITLGIVPTVIYFTLKIDGISAAHQQELFAKTEALALCQSECERFETDLAAKDKNDALLREIALKTTVKPNSPVAPISVAIDEQPRRAWETLTSKEKEAVWFAEIRRVAEKPELTEDECRQTYKSFDFSIRLQLETKLQNTQSLRQILEFHQDLHRDSKAKSVIKAAYSPQRSAAIYMQILSHDHQKQILEMIRKDQRTMVDKEAWEAFIQLGSRRQIQIIADLMDSDVLKGALGLLSISSGGFGSNESYEDIEYKGAKIDSDAAAESLGINFIELRTSILNSPDKEYP